MKTPRKVLFLGLDAALPDLITKFADEGNLPNIAKLMDKGIFSRIETVFPPLTAAAWSAIVAGAGAGTAGIPSLMVKLPNEELDHWHTSFDRDMLLAETLWEVGEESGKKVALVNWPVTFPMGAIKNKGSVQVAGSLNPPFRYFYMPLWDVASSAIFSTEKLACNQIPGRAVVIEPKPADGWRNLPSSVATPLEFEITVPPTYVPGIRYQVLLVDTVGRGYDQVLVCRGKDANSPVATIKTGGCGPWITETFEARDGRRKGRFRFQLFELSPDGKRIRLYQSAINTAEKYTIPEDLTEKIERVAGTFMEVDDPWAFMDGWMPAECYIEQLGLHANWWGKTTGHVLETVEWDMAFSWVGTIDHIQHVLYGGIEPKSRVYDPARYEWCMDAIRTTYKQVDDNIGKILRKVNLEDTLVILVSDHGFTHLDWNPYVKQHLSDAGLLEYILDLTTDDPSNLKIAWSQTKCHPLEPCHAHVFINLKGRDPHGIVEPEDYEKVQAEIIDALYSIKNPETGEPAVALALTKKEAGTVGILEGKGFDRVGDVIYAWKPGFMSHPFIYRVAIKYRDGSERTISNPEKFEPARLCGNFTGVHLALPSLPEMHAVLLMIGPGIVKYVRKHPARIIDIAPTVAKMMNMRVPRDAEGGVLYDVLDKIEG